MLLKTSARALLVVTSVLSAATLAGCQAIVGVEDRDVDPLRTGCTVPAAGETNIRFLNLVPSDDKVDVCVRASGQSFGRPILRGSGTQCPAGFAYAEASRPFPVPAGKIDVKVIKAGGTCSAPALASATGVVTAKGSTTTVVRMGNEKGESLKAFGDTTVRSSGRQRFRVVHAAPGLPQLDIGFATEARLPADISAPLFNAPIAFGESTTPETKSTLGTPDANGYLDVPSTPMNLAIAPTGQKRAAAVANLPGSEGARSVYVVGDPSKPYFPVRGLVCEDLETDGPLKTRCALTALGTLGIDVYNAFLYGAFAQDEKERRNAVIDAIAKRNSDVMCITAMSRKADRDELVAKAKANNTYPHAITYETDLDTKPTDPRDQRPAYAVPACGGTNDPKAVEAAMACIKAKCSTTGTDEGTVKGGSACLSEQCVAELVPFIAGDQNANRCFNCLVISTLSEDPHGKTQALCNTDVRDYRAFDGGASSMVLSKHPLSDVETFVLPSTSYTRLVHYAKVEIEPGKKIDYFCAELTAAFGALVPYHGHYGPDAMKDKWLQEEELQAQRVIEYVRKKAEKRPAIIAGDWATSTAYSSEDGKVRVDDQNGSVIRMLDEALIPAVPRNYTPQCTECSAPANPYNGDLNVWQLRTYLYNMDASAAADASLFFTDSPVTLPTGEKRPLSDRWGFQVLVRRP